MMWAVVAAFGSLLVSSCLGDIIVTKILSNVTKRYIIDEPALFGPPIPLDGFTGLVQYGSPSNGCGTMEYPPMDTNYTGEWIVLVERSNCSFAQKVINAQRAKYSFVIVHNLNSNDIERMDAKGKEGSQVLIPSVFIGEDDGHLIKDRYLYDKGYKILVTGDIPFDLQTYLLPFAITVGICFLVMLTFMQVVKCVRDYRRSRRHRLSSSALKKLPIHKFKKGDPYDCCAICLEDYVDNDKLRVLPCSHAYHCKCIDPWLTKNRRVCPVCKRKVFTGNERPSDIDSDSEDETSPLINSEGGTQGGTFSQQRENPFQAAERAAGQRSRRPRRIETGPEGYQQLDEDSSSEEEEREEEQAQEEVEAEGVEEYVETRPGICRALDAANADTGSSQSLPVVTVLVHGRRGGRRNSGTSIGSSASTNSAPPGPVQIAVDIVNSPPQTTTSQIQPSEEAGEDAAVDYVV
ncbi:godzilla E3 ubiquitin protein ligase isoform X2 [Oratosquilla oratoria]|uniref:godzilla E3 ubiquitin protein ligase isoform X2 n=1 Tax=Oratosquilla oratoria TaxID=337810 RepID=UPI003F75C555